MADDAEEIVVLTVQADTITDDWNWSAAYFSFWMRRFDACLALSIQKLYFVSILLCSSA